MGNRCFVTSAWAGVIDEFQLEDELPRRRRELEADRALHAGRARQSRMVSHFGRQDDVDETVDVCDVPDEGWHAAGVRVRVS